MHKTFNYGILHSDVLIHLTREFHLSPGLLSTMINQLGLTLLCINWSEHKINDFIFFFWLSKVISARFSQVCVKDKLGSRLGYSTAGQRNGLKIFGSFLLMKLDLFPKGVLHTITEQLKNCFTHRDEINRTAETKVREGINSKACWLCRNYKSGIEPDTETVKHFRSSIYCMFLNMQHACIAKIYSLSLLTYLHWCI